MNLKQCTFRQCTVTRESTGFSRLSILDPTSHHISHAIQIRPEKAGTVVLPARLLEVVVYFFLKRLLFCLSEKFYRHCHQHCRLGTHSVA